MNVRQLSFAAGEIAPALYGRVDQVKYSTGLKTLRNFMVMRHGGAINRPGTKYIAEVKDSSKKVRLIPFIYGTTGYVLELGNLYMRVYLGNIQGIVEGAGGSVSLTGATQANPCAITYTPNNLASGNEISITSVVGMTELNVRHFKFTQTGIGQGTLQFSDGTNVNSTSFGAYVSGGAAFIVYEIPTTYVEADLATLQYAQVQNEMIITHPNYAPRKLTKDSSGLYPFTLALITFGASIAAPTGCGASGGPAGSKTFNWVVTAVASETDEESLASNVATRTSIDTPTTSSPVTLTWSAVTGAIFYNVYREINGTYGWIGVAGSISFSDTGYTPDPLDIPPVSRLPFGSSSNYPSSITHYQQRAVYANTINNSEKIWTSKTGLPLNMMVSTPIQDDDAIIFKILGRNLNAVKHMLDIGRLIIFTSSGEWVVDGDAAGILTPSAINLRQHTTNGSGSLSPLVVSGSAIYVQARGGIIRDLGYDYQADGYRGNELTIFSAHLFDGYTISDWSYQQIPHSIVWCVRSDGMLLGMTYVKEHQVFGWHRHDFDGTVENVSVIPGTLEDNLYLIIKRTINGKTVRYVEVMTSRQFTDIKNAIFVDCAYTYDGRNTDSATMTLSGGTTWTYTETLTLTTSIGGYFTSADIGKEIHITGSDGTIIRFTIEGYSSGTVVTGKPNKTVPVVMRNTAITNWARTIKEITGLWHIEGKKVSVFGDGFVTANPNNASYSELTITSGKITLDRFYGVAHVGLPITADMGTLNIDIPGISSIADKKKLINRLSLIVESSRGIWAGPDSSNLTEFKLRESEGYDEPPELETGTIELNIRAEWNYGGQIFIRQTDPVPLSILSIIPTGYIGG